MKYGLLLTTLLCCNGLSQADESHPVNTDLSGTTLNGYVDTSATWVFREPNHGAFRPFHPMGSSLMFSAKGIGYVADGGVNTPPDTSSSSGGITIPSRGGGVGLPGLPGYHQGPIPVPPVPVPEGPGSTVSIDFSTPGVSTVPEPSTVGLLLSGLGIVILLVNRSPKNRSS